MPHESDFKRKKGGRLREERRNEKSAE